MAGAAFPAVVFSLLGAAILFVGSASAAWHAQVFVVGGEPRGWAKPTAPNEESYNHWAARNRFHVGDFLHFKYDRNDSVLVVNRDDYQLCVTDKPTQRFAGGDTRIRLDHSGSCYFISGAPNHCDAGQRMTLRAQLPEQQEGSSKPGPGPAKAPTAMSPGDDDDEGGEYDAPPSARSNAPPAPGARSSAPPDARSTPPGSGAGSPPGSAGSVSRPPPDVAAGADKNKTSPPGEHEHEHEYADHDHDHDHEHSSSPSLRGHRVLVIALAALPLLLPA